jgi:cation transport ATPase
MTGNVLIAVLFNIVGMGLAAMGLITPSLAITVMILSIFAILANTLRIRGLDLQREEIAVSEPLAEMEFLIPNMVCEGCAETISSALQTLPGVCAVQPKVQQKHVAVRYEPARIQIQELQRAVEKAGFTAIEA